MLYFVIVLTQSQLFAILLPDIFGHRWRNLLLGPEDEQAHVDATACIQSRSEYRLFQSGRRRADMRIRAHATT